MCSTDGISSVSQAQQSQVRAQIGIAVIREGLKATQVQGEAAVQLISAATEIAKQLGQGNNINAVA